MEKFNGMVENKEWGLTLIHGFFEQSRKYLLPRSFSLMSEEMNKDDVHNG